MRIPHARLGPAAGSTPAADRSADHPARWHLHVDWGHMAAGMAALMIAIVVMWFFYQP